MFYKIYTLWVIACLYLGIALMIVGFDFFTWQYWFIGAVPMWLFRHSIYIAQQSKPKTEIPLRAFE